MSTPATWSAPTAESGRSQIADGPQAAPGSCALGTTPAQATRGSPADAARAEIAATRRGATPTTALLTEAP